MSYRHLKPALGAAIIGTSIVCIGCGGGSSSENESIVLTISPNPINSSYKQGSLPREIQLKATFNKPLTNKSTVSITIPGGLLKEDRVVFSQESSLSFYAYLTPNPILQVGEHSGNFIINVSNPNLINEIPYNFIVSPGNIVTGKLDDVPLSGFWCRAGGNSSINAVSEQKIELISSVPVIWSPQSLQSAGYTDYSLISSSESSWVATVSTTVSPGQVGGSIRINVKPVNDPQYDFDVSIDVYGK